MNEAQLKGYVRQAFALQDAADRSVLDVDELLGRVMLDVKRLVQSGLPDEGLLRQKTWREMRPLVLAILVSYVTRFRESIKREELTAAPDMEAYARREAEQAGAKLKPNQIATAAFVLAAIGRTKLGKGTFDQLFEPTKNGVIRWSQGAYSVIDKKVQTGILQGLTTEEIADGIIKDMRRNGVPGVSLRGGTAAQTVRSQAMAVARTMTQAVQSEIKDQLWLDNAKALDGFVWQWTALLDSRTCATCAPLDGKTARMRQGLPPWPIHFNCRCQVLLAAPGTKDRERLGEQLGEKPFKGPRSYRTKVKVKGEKFFRRYEYVQGDSYADYLASSNLLTQQQFFGGGPAGERRARFFRRELDRMNKDPQEILQSMLTGPTSARKFIPIR